MKVSDGMVGTAQLVSNNISKDSKPKFENEISPINPDAKLAEALSNGVKKFAYAFYATSDNYACSAIIAGNKIKKLGTSDKIDIVLIHTKVSSNFVKSFVDLGPNFKEIPIEVDQTHRKSNFYYQLSFAKIFVYSLYQYSRVIFMDSDGIPLHNLDHLFLLPSTPLAAPRFYWANSNVFTSAFMVVEPSKTTFELLSREDAGRQNDDMYDMDLLIKIFSNTALLLPPEYCCLNSHWEDNNTGPFSETLESLFSKRCMYMHYTAFGKPWTSNPEVVRKVKPTAHPLFAQQFADWRQDAETFCPK